MEHENDKYITLCTFAGIISS